MIVAGENTNLTEILANAIDNDIIYIQTVSGIDYLDWSLHTLSRVDIQLTDAVGTVVNIRGNNMSCSFIFVQIAEEEHILKTCFSHSITT